jgi:hypothetical protein
MDITLLPGRPPDWDERIATFDTKTLFHESVWLDFVLQRHPQCRIAYYQIHSGGQCAGYFCAVLKLRAGLLLWESPDTGRGMHINPIVNHDIDKPELIAALVRLCHRERIASTHLCLDGLSPQMMHALGFETSLNISQVCTLDGGGEAVWARMHKTRRTSIRKAIKDGLQAEVTDDPAIVDEFFRSYVKALARKRLSPTYGPDEIRSMLRTLLPARRVLPVRVKQHERVVGAAFFLHDDKVMYFWDGASDPDTLHSYPNDLLHWTALQTAAARDMKEFHMSSGPAPQPPNRFPVNFGCRQRERTVYTKAFAPLLAPLRKAYHSLKEFSLKGALVRMLVTLDATASDGFIALIAQSMMSGSP